MNMLCRANVNNVSSVHSNSFPKWAVEDDTGINEDEDDNVTVYIQPNLTLNIAESYEECVNKMLTEADQPRSLRTSPKSVATASPSGSSFEGGFTLPPLLKI